MTPLQNCFRWKAQADDTCVTGVRAWTSRLLLRSISHPFLHNNNTITVQVSVAIAIGCTIDKHFQNCSNSSIVSKLNMRSELQSSDPLVFWQETATFPETPHFSMTFTSLGFTSEHSMAKEYSGPRTNKVWYSAVHSILNSPDDFLWITLANWHSSFQSKRSFSFPRLLITCQKFYFGRFFFSLEHVESFRGKFIRQMKVFLPRLVVKRKHLQTAVPLAEACA